jgi:hypothetical protein
MFALPAHPDGLTKADLQRLTNELIDEVRGMLRRCVDADVVFVPVDAKAHDAGAATPEAAAMPWTLGHIIVHMTATSEEAAALAAELARGVAYHGRSRWEVPWGTVTTIAQCRRRLEESRRMRRASLEMWPDTPALDNTYAPWDGAPQMGPVYRFLFGLEHDAVHLDHLRDVIGQARTHRLRKTLLGRIQLRWRAQLDREDALAATT